MGVVLMFVTHMIIHGHYIAVFLTTMCAAPLDTLVHTYPVLTEAVVQFQIGLRADALAGITLQHWYLIIALHQRGIAEWHSRVVQLAFVILIVEDCLVSPLPMLHDLLWGTRPVRTIATLEHILIHGIRRE